MALSRGRDANHAYTVTEHALDPDLHIPLDRPLTGREVLADALGRTDQDRSAHETIADEYEHADSLERLIPEYEHGLAVYYEDRLTDAVRAALDPPRRAPATAGGRGRRSP